MATVLGTTARFNPEKLSLSAQSNRPGLQPSEPDKNCTQSSSITHLVHLLHHAHHVKEELNVFDPHEVGVGRGCESAGGPKGYHRHAAHLTHSTSEQQRQKGARGGKQGYKLTITSEGAAALDEETAHLPHRTFVLAEDATKSTQTVVSVEAALRRAMLHAADPMPRVSLSNTAHA